MIGIWWSAYYDMYIYIKTIAIILKITFQLRCLLFCSDRSSLVTLIAALVQAQNKSRSATPSSQDGETSQDGELLPESRSNKSSSIS